VYRLSSLHARAPTPCLVAKATTITTSRSQPLLEDAPLVAHAVPKLRSPMTCRLLLEPPRLTDPKCGDGRSWPISLARSPKSKTRGASSPFVLSCSLLSDSSSPGSS
jgi:hypothetical protein